MLLDRVIGSYLFLSFQFGLASAPSWPHRWQRIRGPSDGTEISSFNPSMLTIASWRQFTLEQLTSSDRTPLARMLPRVIGGPHSA